MANERPLHGAFMFVLGAFMLVSCGPASPANEGDREVLSHTVAPDAFAIRRCALQAPCAIVQAGGKVLLFGAPEGAHAVLETAGLPQIDGVFLPSLRSVNLEGLIRVRSQTWIAGREVPLKLVGPDGTTEFAARLDAALTLSDAMTYLEVSPQGGYEAALFSVRDVSGRAGQPVFDTGDLVVLAQQMPTGVIQYSVTYDGFMLQFAPCDGASTQPRGVVDVYLACAEDGAEYAWPFESAVFIVNAQEQE